MGKDRSRIDILEAEGWTRRSVTSEPRLTEAVEMYGASGFEVLLEPLPKGPEDSSSAGDPDSGCNACFVGSENQYMIIFTRPARDGSAPGEDLF
ncbi:MAG: hypothetical protein JRJ06_01385 [Deltaproteobacteria bacterium]|nr:hypothetical protein [Deltaproteobacteria bacterium]MBW1911657.1 hypothetical protein [Deltaproteobacteria bacterium]